MLSLKRNTDSSAVYHPNILPCRIQHHGSVEITKRFWTPSTEDDGTTTSYFRGRKLRGRTVKVPSGYEGILTKSSDQTDGASKPSTALRRGTWRDVVGDAEDVDDEDDNDEVEKEEPVQPLDVVATFDEITVWGHDQLPAADDPFVKGIEEWITFAEAIHSQPQNTIAITGVTPTTKKS